jgi:hypothetical protein
MTMCQCLYLNAIWSYHATHFLSSTSGCCVFYIISPKELPLAHHILLERVSKIKYHVPQHNSTALHLPHREVHAHHRIQDSNSTILYSPSYIHHLIFTILYSPSYVHHLMFTILYSPSYVHHLMFTILCSPSCVLHQVQVTQQ